MLLIRAFVVGDKLVGVSIIEFYVKQFLRVISRETSHFHFCGALISARSHSKFRPLHEMFVLTDFVNVVRVDNIASRDSATLVERLATLGQIVNQSHVLMRRRIWNEPLKVGSMWL